MAPLFSEENAKTPCEHASARSRSTKRYTRPVVRRARILQRTCNRSVSSLRLVDERVLGAGRLEDLGVEDVEALLEAVDALLRHVLGLRGGRGGKGGIGHR